MATADDFRRLALGLDGAEQRSHMSAPDFRVGGAARRTRPADRGILGLHCFSENCRRRSAEAESHSPHQS